MGLRPAPASYPAASLSQRLEAKGLRSASWVNQLYSTSSWCRGAPLTRRRLGATRLAMNWFAWVETPSLVWVRRGADK